MSDPRDALPVIVVGGFLGAGKTTLLSHWLGAAGGRRLAVLVNDFGELAFDAALVREHGADAIALSNGCVCCQIGDELGAALDRVAEQAGRFDAVVVEASGVADPWRIAQYALADRRFVLQAVVVVADAAALPQQAADPLLADTLARGVAHADLLLLNKADVAGPDALAAAQAWAAQHAPRSPTVQTVRGALPLTALADAPHVAKGGALQSSPAHDRRFEAAVLRPAAACDADALRAWALAQADAGVLRLKGRLRLADGRWATLQLAGRRVSLRAAPAPVSAEALAETPALVAIGLRGHWRPQALERSLARCAAIPPVFSDREGARP